MYMDSANTSVTSTTEDQRPSSRLTRSRSLETSKGRATLRSRSLDCAGDRSSPDANEDEEAVSGQRFVVLADYMALTSHEIDLNEVHSAQRPAVVGDEIFLAFNRKTVIFITLMCVNE